MLESDYTGFSLSIGWTVSCMMSDHWFHNDWITEEILIVASIYSVYHDTLQSRMGNLSLLIYFSDLFWDSKSRKSECLLCHSDKELFGILENDLHVITIEIYKDILMGKRN